MALTDKKRRFADALKSGASNRDAAIAAGYSEKTAAQAGSRLAKDPDVLAHIGRKESVVEAQQQAKAEGKPTSLDAISRAYDDPKDFLRAVMNYAGEDMKLRVDAAKVLMPYEHAKPGEMGKKEQKAEAAKDAGKGRFSQSAPPRLAVDNTR